MKFERAKFDKGMYLNYYRVEGERPVFVARFKYRRSDQAGFITFLIKNFTVEEYFDRMANDESPLDILESKGYLASSIKRDLKQMGYQPSFEGRTAYLQAQASKYAS